MGRAAEPIKQQKSKAHGPLASQLKEDTTLSGNNSSKSSKRAGKRQHVEQEAGGKADAVLSARIMKMARDQQREELDGPNAESAQASTSAGKSAFAQMEQDDDEDDDEDYGSEEDDEIEDVEYFNDLVSFFPTSVKRPTDTVA